MMRWMMLCALTCTLATASSVHAEPPSKADAGAAMASRLEAVLERLEAIENRLSRLEEAQRRRDFWVDKNGVMRSASGRPIGFWGIDGPTPAVRTR